MNKAQSTKSYKLRVRILLIYRVNTISLRNQKTKPIIYMYSATENIVHNLPKSPGQIPLLHAHAQMKFDFLRAKTK